MVDVAPQLGSGAASHFFGKDANESIDAHRLSPTALTRFKANDFSWREMNTEHSLGLNIATTAIFDGQVDISDPVSLSKTVEEYTGVSIDYAKLPENGRSVSLACLVRDVANDQGWLAGWTCLSKAAPGCGLWARLIEDVSTSVDVYRRVELRDTARPVVEDLVMEVVSNPAPDSLSQIGPKSLGGHAWKTDKMFDDVKSKWTSAGFGVVAPCTLFGWAGLFKKVVHVDDVPEMISMQLLGTVDYDFDKNDNHKLGMGRSGAVAGRNCIMRGSKLQGGAMVGLLNYDLQHCVRDIQLSWALGDRGAAIKGPSSISPKDWTMALSGDCAALTPYGYIPEAHYDPSQSGQFTSVLVANLHDLLYDHGASNRMSGMMYTVDAGLAQDDIAVAYSIGMVDAIARRINRVTDLKNLIFGDSVYMITFSWAPFNTRYRTWERFVKYTRLLQASSSASASRLLEVSRRGKVLPVSDEDLENIPAGDSWTAAMSPSSPSRLTPRITHSYSLARTSDVFEKYRMGAPDLCSKCKPKFEAAVKTNRQIHAIVGLSPKVVSRDSVGLAAGLCHVATLAATGNESSGESCCDACAVQIGSWADKFSYKVLVAMMASEPESSPQEWLLENYLVVCATLEPTCVISILGGFDAIANAKFEPGAMGERDAVDC